MNKGEVAVVCTAAWGGGRGGFNAGGFHLLYVVGVLGVQGVLGVVGVLHMESADHPCKQTQMVRS